MLGCSRSESRMTNLNCFQAIAHCIRAANVVLQDWIQMAIDLIEGAHDITIAFFNWIQV